jgi:hypothetical protein
VGKIHASIILQTLNSFASFSWGNIFRRQHFGLVLKGKKKGARRTKEGKKIALGGKLIKLALKKFPPIIFFRRIIIVFYV